MPGLWSGEGWGVARGYGSVVGRCAHLGAELRLQEEPLGAPAQRETDRLGTSGLHIAVPRLAQPPVWGSICGLAPL